MAGASPASTDTVKVHYRGTFPDGREFDSSYERGAGGVIPPNATLNFEIELISAKK